MYLTLCYYNLIIFNGRTIIIYYDMDCGGEGGQELDCQYE